MVLAGGEVHQMDVNSTSTIPELNYKVTVEGGTTNRIVGSSRGRINGSFEGLGDLTIETRYVRCDVGADFSAFEGKLTAVGSQFRLMSTVKDMSKTRLIVGAGTYIAHFKGGSASETGATLKVGSLSSPSTATDGVLGGGSSTYEIGYLNENSTFYGLLKAASVVKVGSGKLSLRTAGHTSPITVNGGTLELNNAGSAVMTTGSITVGRGGTLSGNGLAGSVTVSAGGMLAAGTTASGAGTLRMSSLTVRKGGTVRCRLTNSNNSKFKVSGNITHNNDTLLIIVPATRTLVVGEELEIFPPGFSSASGSVVVKCESEEVDYTFDTSTLNTDGKVRVEKIETTGVTSPIGEAATTRAFDLQGRQVTTPQRGGIYVIDGKKVLRK